MTDKDYLLDPADLPDGINAGAFKDFKKATFKQLRDLMIVNDYVFCSLLQTSRLPSLDPNLL